jgi:hypothetical protein
MDEELLPFALVGLIQRRNEIIAKIAEIRIQLGEVSAAPVAPGAPPAATKKRGKRKRTLSPEARARIAEAQRKRWAATRTGAAAPVVAKAVAKTATKKAATKKRTMSPEARARIAEAQRKRWAATRKAAK